MVKKKNDRPKEDLRFDTNQTTMAINIEQTHDVLFPHYEKPMYQSSDQSFENWTKTVGDTNKYRKNK